MSVHKAAATHNAKYSTSRLLCGYKEDMQGCKVQLSSNVHLAGDTGRRDVHTFEDVRVAENKLSQKESSFPLMTSSSAFKKVCCQLKRDKTRLP